MKTPKVPCTTEPPPHGKILALYAAVWDRHLGRQILIPVTRQDIAKGRVRLP